MNSIRVSPSATERVAEQSSRVRSTLSLFSFLRDALQFKGDEHELQYQSRTGCEADDPAEIPDGSLAIVLDGEFKGELFFKNVAGLHSISQNRYWESDYARSKRGYVYGGFQGPLSAACQLIAKGDVLKIEEAK